MYSSIAVLTALAVGALAQEDSSSSVSSFFFGGPTVAQQSWGASVISAGSDGTAYEIVCTGGIGCPSTARSISQTITLGPSSMDYGYSTEVAGNAASVTEHCDITGTTAAVCTVTATLEIGDESTNTATTTTYSGSDYALQPVTITAGLEKLASASASATGTSSSDTGSSESSSSGTGSSASSSSSASVSASSSSGSDTSGAQSSGRAGDVMALVMIPSVVAVVGALFML